MASIRVQQLFSIEKSENDDRLYRGIQLTNGLKALLISDQAIEKSAAALAVGVGSNIFEPGTNAPGMVRLYQRMLYLTDQLEHSRLFRTTVATADGTFNAETQAEFTTYYFDINSSSFSAALSVFANLFKEFQLPENVIIAQEICHVKRELAEIKLDDRWKIAKFVEWMTYYHEYKEDIDKEQWTTEHMQEEYIKIMLEMIEELYCPSNMTLCVLGRESLDSLEAMVANSFTLDKKTIPDDVSCMSLPNSSVYKVCYVPHEAYNKLHIVFDCCTYNYATDRFLDYLFEYDSRGSLLWLLKARNWGTSIKAGSLDEVEKTLYSVCISLTEDGVDNIDNIMTLFFQYVNMLENNNLRGVYNEYKEIQEIKFRLKEKEPSLTYVRLNAQTMLKWPMEYVLRGRHVPIEWKQKSVKDAFENFLTPLCMRIYVASKQYETVTDSKSPYYNFKIEEVPMETYAKWMKANHCAELNLPACNEFIPATTNLKPHEDEVEMFPQIIKKTKLLTMRHLRDKECNEAKSIMFFRFISQYACTDDNQAHYTFMFVNLINKCLSEYVHPAALVDLHWKIFAINKGIEVKISGLDNKQHVVLEKIIELIMYFQVILNPEDFEDDQLDNIKTSLKELEIFHKDVPWEQAKYYLSLLLIGRSWDKEAIKSCYNITYEKFNKFLSDFTKSMYVEGLIHGNITRAEALDITRIIETKLSHVTAVQNMNLVCLILDATSPFYLVFSRVQLSIEEYRKSFDKLGDDT